MRVRVWWIPIALLLGAILTLVAESALDNRGAATIDHRYLRVYNKSELVMAHDGWAIGDLVVAKGVHAIPDGWVLVRLSASEVPDQNLERALSTNRMFLNFMERSETDGRSVTQKLTLRTDTVGEMTSILMRVR